MENNFIIYRHISPSGKSYIGLTSRKPEKRRNNGNGYKKSHQIKFHNAILKYGWDNFEHLIIETDIQTLEEAKKREQYWIAYYDSYNHGYNATIGGDGGHNISEEAKKKIREHHLGMKASKESRKKMSCSQINRWKNISPEEREKFAEKFRGKEPWNKGITHSDETKEKLRQINFAKEYKHEWYDKCRIWISQNNLDGQEVARFLGVREAGRITGIDSRSISKVLTGKRKTAGGYIWKKV